MITKARLWQMVVIPFLAAVCVAARADVPPPKPDLSPLYEQWQLEDVQIAELESYIEQMREARTALRDQEFESRQERREAMKALREEHKANLATILSEDQMKDLKAYMRQFGHHRGNKKRRGPAEQVEG